MENTIENARKFLEPHEQSRQHPHWSPDVLRYMQQKLVAYANSVRPEVKLPSDDQYEITFGLHLKCKVIISNDGLQVLGAMNGWGDGVPGTEIEIKRLNPGTNFVESK